MALQFEVERGGLAAKSKLSPNLPCFLSRIEPIYVGRYMICFALASGGMVMHRLEEMGMDNYKGFALHMIQWIKSFAGPNRVIVLDEHLMSAHDEMQSKARNR